MNEVEIRVKSKDDTGPGFRSATSGAERLNKRLRDLGGRMNTLRLTATALGPALVPVFTVATGAVINTAGAIAGGTAALGVFGAVTKTAFTEVKDASDKTKDLRDKMRLLKKEIEVSPSEANRKAFLKSLSKAQDEYNARLALLPPVTREAVRSYDKMTVSWQNFVDKNKPAVFSIMSTGMDLIGKHIKDLQPLFDTGASFAKQWAGELENAVENGGVKKLVNFLDERAAPALGKFSIIASSLIITAKNLVSATPKDGGGLLTFLVRLSTTLRDWSGTGFQNFQSWLAENGPKVYGVLINLYGAFIKIGQAVTPLAPVSLAIADALARIIKALPPNVLTTLVASYLSLSVAIKACQVATEGLATAQIATNAVFAASPIGRVVALVMLLVGVYVLAKRHSLEIANFTLKAWNMIKNAVLSAVSFIIGLLDKLLAGIQTVVGVFGKLPGKLGAPFRAMASSVEGARNKIQALRNSVEGLKSKKITVRVDQIGAQKVQRQIDSIQGKSVFVRVVTGHITGVGGGHIAEEHGGIVGKAAGGGPRSNLVMVGEHGRELVDLPPGSRVHSNPDTERLMSASGGGQPFSINLILDGKKIAEVMLDPFRNIVRTKGGNVQAVLGS